MCLLEHAADVQLLSVWSKHQAASVVPQCLVHLRHCIALHCVLEVDKSVCSHTKLLCNDVMQKGRQHDCCKML